MIPAAASSPEAEAKRRERDAAIALADDVVLRKEVGGDYRDLLRFFLNHRRFLRSEHPQRVGKSPAELLNGQAHAHWLEMLGYQLFSRTQAA